MKLTLILEKKDPTGQVIMAVCQVDTIFLDSFLSPTKALDQVLNRLKLELLDDEEADSEAQLDLSA
jgi:hypothetical protein